MLARDRFAVGSCDVVVVLGVGKGRVMLATKLARDRTLFTC